MGPGGVIEQSVICNGPHVGTHGLFCGAEENSANGKNPFGPSHGELTYQMRWLASSVANPLITWLVGTDTKH